MALVFRLPHALGRALLCAPLVALVPQPALAQQTPKGAAPAPAANALKSAFVTQPVGVDSDDPAIWINRANPAKSLIVGTDKGDTTGGLYVFNLDGTIDRAKTRTPMLRTNNVDIISGFMLGGKSVDLAVTTERGGMRLRVFRLPDMTAIDGGGIPVFDGDKERGPMGVALYRRAKDGAVFAIVGGKSGPAQGYLWQYRMRDNGDGTVRGEKVRAFGAYSGKKEIESIVVDQQLGYVYYSDETVGIRKYYADPDRAGAARELAFFATTGFVSDHEGLAVYATSATTGYLVASDQQGHRIQIFPREGTAGKPHAHPVLAVIPVSAIETDGLEVTAAPLGPRFPQGILVMMSTDRTFHVYDWRDVAKRIKAERKP